MYFTNSIRVSEMIMRESLSFDRYELDDCDTPFICTEKLLEYGIDISEWEKEADKMVEN